MMIDIEKERAAFEAWYGAPNPLKRDNNGNYLYAEANTAWGVWLAAKKHASEQDRWISVKESLPKPNETILLQDCHNKLRLGRLDSDSEVFVYLHRDRWLDFGAITHWRYLPVISQDKNLI